MIFAASAVRLCGQCALLLGWRPAEFWTATPAELASIFELMMPHNDLPPDARVLQTLMERFPDTPTEVTNGRGN
jgi:hypothetical protein